MASEVSIANRALQRLGATRITSLTENTRNARTMNAVYASVRDSELRAHPWNFAIKRAQLAADTTAPLFGPSNAFPLPSDFLKLITPDLSAHYNNLDWKIEGRRILTDDDAPLEIRYIYRVTDPNQMDSLFQEAFAIRMAKEVCEELTQSNSKLQILFEDYDRIIAEARKANAFEQTTIDPPEDTWLSVRR